MKGFLHNTWKHRAHVVMALPVFLILFFIMYVPMGGLVMAFKNYDFSKGIWGSPWAGLDNFQFLQNLLQEMVYLILSPFHLLSFQPNLEQQVL